MSRMDSTAAAALTARVIRPVFFAYLDIVGDPLRACTAEMSLQPFGSGDSDLDGQVFDALNPTIVDIGPVAMKSGGSDSLTARLSGIVGLDDALLAVIGNKANWQGRVARLWRMIRDENGAQQGAIQHYYTGYMVALDVEGSPESQTINLTIESYLVAFSQASNRTYLDQDRFDPGDLSAKAAIAIANGISGNPLISNTPVGAGAGSFGGGSGGRILRNLE